MNDTNKAYREAVQAIEKLQEISSASPIIMERLKAIGYELYCIKEAFND